MNSKWERGDNRSKLFIGLLMFAFVIGSFCVYTTWQNSILRAQSEAIHLASSAASFIQPQQLQGVRGNLSDLQSTDYQTLKDSLLEFKNKNVQIQFAYLLMMKNEKIYFMVDSELPGTSGYCPPGQEYVEAPKEIKEAFGSSGPVLADSVTNQLGKWFRVFVPIKDPETGVVTAVLGVDYPVKSWVGEINKHVLQALVVVGMAFAAFCLLDYIKKL